MSESKNPATHGEWPTIEEQKQYWANRLDEKKLFLDILDHLCLNDDNTRQHLDLIVRVRNRLAQL